MYVLLQVLRDILPYDTWSISNLAKVFRLVLSHSECMYYIHVARDEFLDASVYIAPEDWRLLKKKTKKSKDIIINVGNKSVVNKNILRFNFRFIIILIFL